MKRYAIIKNASYHVEGDERSRTNPGHGYPAHTVSYKDFREHKTREEWEKEIRRLANPRYGMPEKFEAIIFESVEVTTEVKVKLGS